MQYSKNKVFILLVLFSIVLLFSACGTKDAAPVAGSANPARTFSQNQPDLYGEVKSVSGSQLTIALLESPQGAQGSQRQQRPQMTDAERQKMVDDRKNNPQGSRSNPQNNSSGPGARFSVEKKYTGKSETIIISADTSITSFGRGSGNANGNGNGNQQNGKLSLSDIKVGTIIQVWYKKDTGDKKEIQNIRLVQVPN